MLSPVSCEDSLGFLGSKMAVDMERTGEEVKGKQNVKRKFKTDLLPRASL